MVHSSLHWPVPGVTGDSGRLTGELGAVPGGEGTSVKGRQGPASPQFMGRETPGLLSPPPFTGICLSTLTTQPGHKREEHTLWAIPLDPRDADPGPGCPWRDGRRKGARNLIKQTPPELSFGVPCVKSAGKRYPARGRVGHTPETATQQGFTEPTPAPPGSEP